MFSNHWTSKSSINTRARGGWIRPGNGARCRTPNRCGTGRRRRAGRGTETGRDRGRGAEVACPGREGNVQRRGPAGQGRSGLWAAPGLGGCEGHGPGRPGPDRSGPGRECDPPPPSGKPDQQPGEPGHVKRTGQEPAGGARRATRRHGPAGQAAGSRPQAPRLLTAGELPAVEVPVKRHLQASASLPVRRTGRTS